MNLLVPAVKYDVLTVNFASVPVMPGIMHWGAEGHLIAGARFIFIEALDGESEPPFMTITLTGILIEEFKLNAGSNGEPYVTMSLSWESMTVATTGVGGTTATFTPAGPLG